MSKTTCSNGHLMTRENTYLRGGREATCRACHAEYKRRSRARRKALEAEGMVIVPGVILPTQERLLAQVNVLDNGCWEWTGFVNKEGYGRTSYKGQRGTPAQQALYDLLVGPIPAGKVLDHACHTADKSCSGGPRCRHRRCVNPEHMKPMTFEENSSLGVHGRKTHCPQGHPYDAMNTCVSGGRRYCRECGRVRGAEYRAKRRTSSIERSTA